MTNTNRSLPAVFIEAASANNISVGRALHLAGVTTPRQQLDGGVTLLKYLHDEPQYTQQIPSIRPTNPSPLRCSR